ncbi:unnamed protein product [Phaeothamnion confervicola]
MPHDVFQEVVGVVVVPAAGCPRPSLASLQKMASLHLHPAKWPQSVVYMNDLPKGQTNKPQRIRLAERCGLAAVTDATPASARHFEAVAPPKGAGLGAPIAARQCPLDNAAVSAALARAAGVAEAVVLNGVVHGHPDHLCAYVAPVAGAAPPTAETLAAALEAAVHGYMVPHHFVVLRGLLPRLSDNGEIDVSALPAPAARSAGRTPATKAEAVLHAIWQEVLATDEAIGVDEDFFSAGGSSLMAGMVIARCRKAFGVSLGMAAVFELRTIATLAEELERRGGEAALARQRGRGASVVGSVAGSAKTSMESLPTCDSSSDDDVWRAGRSGDDSGAGGAAGAAGGKSRYTKLGGDAEGGDVSVEKLTPASQASLAALLVQSLPIGLLFPTLRWARYVTWVCTLSLLRTSLEREAETLTVWELLVSLWLAGILISREFGAVPLFCSLSWAGRTTIIAASASPTPSPRPLSWLPFGSHPEIACCTQWAVLGRYRAGNYRLWGSYYLRWWLTKQVLNLTGMGIFATTDWSVAAYHRLLGATIGVGAKIDKRARITEHDLVSIGVGTCIDGEARVCPFHMDSGVMLLRGIHVGDDCTLAAKAFIAGGHFVPSGTCMGPCSSSYELADARPEYRDLCRKAFPGPSQTMQWVVGRPVLLAGWVFQALPWILYLYFLVQQSWFISASERRSVYRLLIWFATGNRLAWYVCIRQPIRAIVSPVFYLAYCVLVKRCLVGRFEAGPRPTSDWGRFRHWIMKELLPGGDLGGVAPLVGTHYEIISRIYRLLGAKVGKRVYWPGSGMLGLYEYDLFEVGDDVVFGSRTTVIPCDAKDAIPIRLGDGCMVADRCVLLPGFTIGRNGLLGSGGIGAKNQALAPGSKWLGSTGGSAVCLFEGSAESAAADTIRPFGRAFYERKPSGYYVMPLWQHICFNTFVIGAGAVLWKLPLFAALEAAIPFDNGSVWALLCYFYGFFVAINGIFSVGMLLLTIACKWLVMGRRRPGRYNWDESSYSQRWQLYIILHGLAKAFGETHLLQLMTGSAYMVRYYRALGATIGRDVCLYPNYADPPSNDGAGRGDDRGRLLHRRLLACRSHQLVR